jgi:excisionase family DNA binding protein
METNLTSDAQRYNKDVAYVAQYLGVAEPTIRRWLLLGKIPARKIGHCVRFSEAELQKWVAQQPVVGRFPVEENAVAPLRAETHQHTPPAA